MKVQEGQRVTLAAADDWNTVAVRRGGSASVIDLVATGPLDGTVSDVGAGLALVTLDRGETVIIDRSLDPRVTAQVVITRKVGRFTVTIERRKFDWVGSVSLGDDFIAAFSRDTEVDAAIEAGLVIATAGRARLDALKSQS